MTLTLKELKEVVVDRDTYSDGEPIKVWCEIEGKNGLRVVKRAEFKNEDSYDIVLVIE